MATITRFNNRNPLQQDKTSANVAPSQAPSQPGSQPQQPAGSYSTLQKYLGANKEASQRLGGMVSSGVQRTQQQKTQQTQREMDEAAKANEAIKSLTGETQRHRRSLSGETKPPSEFNSIAGQINQPDAWVGPYDPDQQMNQLYQKGPMVQFGADTSNVYKSSAPTPGREFDVNEYQTNIAGQDYASQLAQNEASLRAFRDIATGVEAQKRAEAARREQGQALTAADAERQLNLRNQQNITTERGRANLLQELLAGQNRRGGIAALDQALLAGDTSGQLNQLNNQLRQGMRGLETRVTGAEQLGRDVSLLGQRQKQEEAALNARVDAMNKQYDESLAGRVDQINKAKEAQVQNLLAQFNQLRGNNEATAEFAKQLGLDKVMAANPNEAGDPLSGVRLFNVVNSMGTDLESGLRKALDTTTLEQKAQSYRDVANARDVQALNALRSLAGGKNDITESRFAGDQTKALLGDLLQKRADEFQKQDMIRRFGGYGNATESMSGSLFGQGTAAARAYYTGQLGDVLNQTGTGIDKYLYSGSKGQDNYDDTTRQIATEGLSSYDPLLSLTQQSETMRFPAPAPGSFGSRPLLPNEKYVVDNGQLYIETTLPAAVTQVRDAGLGLSQGDVVSPSGEYGRTLTTAQQRASQGLQGAVDQYLNNIGYKNLLRIIGSK